MNGGGGGKEIDRYKVEKRDRKKDISVKMRDSCVCV